MKKEIKEIKITDIKGIKVGHAQDEQGGTGCTVILCENGARAGVNVRGGAPASRETELLRAENMVEAIHAVTLSGGSAYGLDACAGVMAFLEEKGIGFDTGVAVVPIVCGASLFDLTVGDAKSRPDKAMGYAACAAAGKGDPEEGNVGAGTGASVGKIFGPDRMMKSGLGIFAVQVGDVQCAAVVAVNALGDVADPVTGKRVAGLLSEDKSELTSTAFAMYEEIDSDRSVFSGNTTIGCIITNAKLTKPQCNKLALIAQNGLALAIHPAHTSVDGDMVFALATGEVEVSPDALGALSSEVMAYAVVRAAREAKPAYGLKASSDFPRD